MASKGAVPGFVSDTNGFLLLRGSKSDARSTIPRKLMLWSQVVMAMA